MVKIGRKKSSFSRKVLLDGLLRFIMEIVDKTTRNRGTSGHGTWRYSVRVRVRVSVRVRIRVSVRVRVRVSVGVRVEKLTKEWPRNGQGMFPSLTCSS